MKFVSVRNVDRDAELGGRVRVADRWWPRLRGMIGRPEPEQGEGLLLMPCQGVHMHWMGYALDVAFLDPAMAGILQSDRRICVDSRLDMPQGECGVAEL